MVNAAERILYRKSVQIFEELAFLMPRAELCGSLQERDTSAVVRFNGPFSGYLLLSLSPDLAKELSCNMLGDTKGEDAGFQQDSIGEIANIICGNALPAIFGFERVFYLEAPYICTRETHVSDFSQAAQARILFETGTAEVMLFTESRALNNLPK